MTISLLGSLTGGLLGWLMGFLSLFLILLILIQRGKGGGLTGALGGPGGQSAFGSKAGDTFTVITIVVASIWGLTCAFTMWLLGTHAPTPVTKTNVQAGPGDEDADVPTTGSDMIIPPADTSGLGSFDSLQLSPNTTDDSSTETPSVELTPANTETDNTATESTESATETTETPGADSDASTDSPPAESTDGAAGDGTEETTEP